MKMLLMCRRASTAEIGNVVVFLASGKADYMTRPPLSSTGVCRRAAWVCDPRPPETGTTK